jgi:hypothetical protein
MIEGAEFRVPVIGEIFPLHFVQNGTGAHPAFYPVGNWGSFLENKATRT